MSLADNHGRRQRALLAAGTASYDSPEFATLDKVPDSLRTIVEAFAETRFRRRCPTPGIPP
jgi:hypothetical protein